MAIVKGYYNINNGVFLGPMTATAEDSVAHTPRYVEGVCFGEYNTDTHEFIPTTNPMIIPRGSIFTVDQQFDASGNLVNRISGIEEDRGLDLVAKRLKGFATGRRGSSNVETRDSAGRVYPDAKIVPATTEAPSETPRPKITGQIAKEDLPVFDLDALF